VGSRNALELRVVDGWIRLGEAFAVPAPAGTAKRAVVFFRPEDVTVTPSGPGQPARLEVKIFLGSQTRLHLAAEVDGSTVRFHADLPSRQALEHEPGAILRVRVDPGHLRIFPLDA
jgi:hypothetical protein